MGQAFINVVIPFDDRRAFAVNEKLRTMGRPFRSVAVDAEPPRGVAAADEEDTSRNAELDAALNAAGMVHFMSITVIEPVCPAEVDRPGPASPARRSGKAHLVIEISADGGIAEVLSVIAGCIGPQLSEILGEARVWQDSDGPLDRFLRSRHVGISQAWRLKTALGQTFGGSPGMSVRRILFEEKLARWVGKTVEGLRAKREWLDRSPTQRLEMVRDLLWSQVAASPGGLNADEVKEAFVPASAPLLGGAASNYAQAGLWIGNSLLWPIYPLLLLVMCVAFAVGLRKDSWLVASMWALTVGVMFLGALLVAVLLGYLRLRKLEQTDLVEDFTPSSRHVEQLMAQENFHPQNLLASVSRLKPGLVRRLTLRIAFTIVGAGRFVGLPGHLGNNGVIHFARWMRLPGTDQLLFWSNYDGTWESYVADFIADAPSGVTAIWSNCVGFPRSANLFSLGATDRDRLVRWARRQQHPAYYWYPAYADLTADRVRVNAAIRQGIAAAESTADAEDWLSLFGSSPRPSKSLEIQEIPTLVFGGLSSLGYASCHVVSFSGDPARCREWLAVAAQEVTFGERLPGQPTAVALALSATGLARLGVPQDAIETFPPAFKQGMWPSWRARALGDTGKNDPLGWQWGMPEGAPEHRYADVFLVLYGATDRDRHGLFEKLSDAAARLGHGFSHQLVLTPLRKPVRHAAPDAATPPAKSVFEPFGFADGISQPIIRGVPRANVHSARIHLVEPGEIVLGYPDNQNVIPPSPSISDRHDPEHLLEDVGTDPTRQRPEFSRYEGSGRRDLGVNGTFFVARQLQQNVQRFNDWLDESLERFKGGKQTGGPWVGIENNRVTVLHAPPPRPGTSAASWESEAGVDTDTAHQSLLKEWIAAKLNGRWKDGTSLARNPQIMGTALDRNAVPDNAFLLGEEDPSGLRCPLGAHIRRANPRDTRFPGSQTEIAAVNRHRILRVGRRYGPREGAAAPQGLMFMCLQADIDRQFEFIQKTWLLNPNIHGLEDEIDPFIGRGERSITIPTLSGPLRLTGMPDFAQVVGGGYFFMPGRSVLRYLATDALSAAGDAG